MGGCPTAARQRHRSPRRGLRTPPAGPGHRSAPSVPHRTRGNGSASHATRRRRRRGLASKQPRRGRAPRALARWTPPPLGAPRTGPRPSRGPSPPLCSSCGIDSGAWKEREHFVFAAIQQWRELEARLGGLGRGSRGIATGTRPGGACPGRWTALSAGQESGLGLTGSADPRVERAPRLVRVSDADSRSWTRRFHAPSFNPVSMLATSLSSGKGVRWLALGLLAAPGSVSEEANRALHVRMFSSMRVRTVLGPAVAVMRRHEAVRRRRGFEPGNGGAEEGPPRG